MYILHLIPQPWRDEAADLGQFLDPVAAALELQTEDVEGTRGETRIEAVERKIMEEYKKFVN